MTYSPPATGQPDPMVLSTMTDDIAATVAWVGGGGASSALSANVAYFIPVRLTDQHTYVKAWWLNGGTAAGNIDVGIYTLSGTTLTRVVASVAEAQGTISTMQVAASFTPTTIGPGIYYLAVSSTSSSSTIWRGSFGTTTVGRLVGCYQASSSSPLPSSVTATTFATTFAPVFGFSENTVI